MSPDDLIALNEQIAGMARAGLPLDQGLASLAKDMGRGRLRSVTQTLAADLRAGTPLPDALAKQKTHVPPYYASLVLAGIRTGRLPEALATLTTYARTIAQTRATVIDALLYPGIVLACGLTLVICLCIFILPMFDKMYQEFGMTLPWVTQQIMVLGRYPLETFTIPLGVGIVLMVVIWLCMKSSPSLRQRLTRVLYMTPIMGQLIRAARLTAFSELLAMLVRYEVPLPEAFNLAAAACTDPVMAGQALKVEERLSQGVSLADAFRGRGLLPEWVAWMAGAGERQGGLSSTLGEIAEIYRRQVESRAAMLRTILPSFVVIATAGLLTGFVAVSLFVPFIKLLEGLSK